VAGERFSIAVACLLPGLTECNTALPMRAIWLAIIVTAACGSRGQDDAPERVRDARLAPVDAISRDASLEERLALLEPVVGPPAPTVKPGSKGDCRTEYAPRPNRDPNPMCAIDGGTFMMGDENGPAGKPVKTDVASFYIDQFEVTVAQAAHFLNTHGNWCGTVPCSQHAAFLVREEGKWKPETGRDRRPMQFDPEGARFYCAWVGKRLPTEAEWEYAGRHDPKTNRDYRFAWGDTWETARADCAEEVCADGFPPGNPPDVGTFDGSGGRKDGTSPWGVHDMVGSQEESVEGCGPGHLCKNCRFVDADCPPLGKGAVAWIEPEEAVLTRRLLARGGARCALSPSPQK
jgi:formylglycine-generating enzyme required for sulfatase activity